MNEALYLLTHKYTDHVYTKINEAKKVFKSIDLQIKGAETEHFSQKAERKNGLIVYTLNENSKISSTWHRKKRNLTVSITRPVAPRGHPLLLLLFFQNKSCMHNEVGTCTEILPITYFETMQA